MGFQLSRDEGEYLVRLAREAIEMTLRSQRTINPLNIPKSLQVNCGVFITLNKVTGSGHSLRGCIGFPYPVKPLVEAVVDSAISAATRDMRFPNVTLDEMGSISIEVSVLTPPEVIKVQRASEYPDHVKIGEDGLIIGRGEYRGLLLPQVAVDYGWGPEEFLSQCSVKAWLPRDAWKMPGTEVSKFQAIIYGEESPRGLVKRMELHG
jgi:uncharacterized protein (TIGR00296 family)